MRRTLAVALAAGVLMIGGCARQHPPAPAVPAAPASGQAVTQPAAHRTAPRGDDVDQLLDQVDKQISSDDQPAQDQD